MAQTTYVQSLDPTTAKPVAVTSIAAGAIQHVHLRDVSSETIASVRSYAGSNPLAVALTDPTGAHTTVVSIAGVVVASLAGQPTFTASVPGNLFVTGSVQATQAGVWSAGVTQITSPWVVLPGSSGAVALTVASQAGQYTVTASVSGVVPVVGSVQATQQTSPWVVLPGSSGAIVSVVGSAGVTQLGSWSVFVQGSDGTRAQVDSFAGGGLLRVAVYSTAGGGAAVAATQVGCPWTVIGSTQATQAGSWSTFIQGSDGTRAQVDSFGAGGLLRVAVYSLTNAGVATTNSVYASQVGCPWSFIGSAGVTELGSWSVFVQGSDGTRIQVDSFGGGGVLRVAVYSTAGGGTNVAATQVGCPWTVIGSVGATQLGAPWTITGSEAIQGQVASGASLAGNPVTVAGLGLDYAQTSFASVGCATLATFISDRMGRQRVAVDTGQVGITGQVTVTASLIGTQTVIGSVQATQAGAPWSVVGSVQATQANTPWLVLGSVAIQGGSLTAFQGGAPWTVTGSAAVQGQVASGAAWAGNPLGAGAFALDYAQTSFASVGCATMVPVLADRMGRLRVAVDTGQLTLTGQQTVTASVIGVLPIVGSVGVTQVGVWSAGVTQITSPWVVLAGSSGAVALTVASQAGQYTVTASIIGVPSFVGSVAVQGQVASGAGLIGNPVTVGGLGLDYAQTSFASVGCATFATFIADRMGRQRIAVDTGQLAVTGQVTVTASLIGVPSVIGSVGVTQLGVWSAAVTQATSPWVVLPGSSGATFLTVTSVIGQPTVTASISGVPGIVGSVGVTQLVGPFTVVIASATQGPGIVTIAMSITAPASVQGGALNVRAFAARSGKTCIFSFSVFSWGATGAASVVSKQSVALNAEGYQSFVLYTSVTVAATPTELRIRPQFTDDLTATSYYDMGQGFWADVRISDNVVRNSTNMVSGRWARTLTGPVMGPNLQINLDGDTRNGSGSLNVNGMFIEFVNAPLWMGT